MDERHRVCVFKMLLMFSKTWSRDDNVNGLKVLLSTESSQIWMTVDAWSGMCM